MSAKKKSPDAQAIGEELTRLAEIAAGMLDGEEVKGIITEQAMHWVANPDPVHRYMAGDYFDVDHEKFLRTKKFLIRLERMGRVRLGSSVWVRVPGTEAVTVAVQNGSHHRYYRFGQTNLPTPPAMKEAFESRQIVPVPSAAGPGAKDGFVTVLAPVRDSLGDVAAVVELTAPLEAEAPSWS